MEATSWWKRGEVDSGMEAFLGAPACCFFCPPRGGKIRKPQLLEGFAKFQTGQWSELVVATSGKGRQKADVPRRTYRGFAVCVGSATRQALECRDSTWDRANPLSFDESVEAPERAKEPSARLGTYLPEEPVVLNEKEFVKSLRNSRRGAAPGPSGMCAEHLRASPTVGRDKFLQILWWVITLGDWCHEHWQSNLRRRPTPHRLSSALKTRAGR